MKKPPFMYRVAPPVAISDMDVYLSPDCEWDLTIPPLIIVAPEADVTQLTEALHHLKQPFHINPTGGLNGVDGTLYFYKFHQLNTIQRQQLLHAVSSGISLQNIVSYFETVMGWTYVWLLDDSYFADVELLQCLQSRRRQWEQRILDLTVGMSLLLCTLPLWGVAACAIKLESSGTVFFQQTRTGLRNKEFTIFKFRTMSQDAEKYGACWSSPNDSRVTRVGYWLRKTRIDELPQLLNVLKGEMSLIGPRPEREFFIQDLEQHIPYYRQRHWVKPGITGLAQVMYRYGASVEDAVHKHRYDIFYLKHQSIWLDLKILFHTVKTVLTGQGV